MSNKPCVVCQQGRTNVLLCQPCATRPDIVAYVETLLAGIERQIEAAKGTLLNIIADNYQAWNNLDAARTAPDWAERAAKNRAAGNIYGQLLDAEATMQQTCAPLESERARLLTALDAIRRVV